MDVTAILALISKGLTILPILINAGESVVGIVQRLQALADKAANGESVSDEELTSLETELDAAIVKFNQPMD